MTFGTWEFIPSCKCEYNPSPPLTQYCGWRIICNTCGDDYQSKIRYHGKPYHGEVVEIDLSIIDVHK
jgi:hypothetical protein